MDRVVIKVGTSSLTHESGQLNLRKIEQLTRVIADIKNAGSSPVLVTSGAIGVGRSKLKNHSDCRTTADKQAAASIGQVELMYIYSRFFSDYGVTVGQILLTKDIMDDPHRKENVTNTMEALLRYGIVPVINENDTVAVDELVFGDNDTLSAYVATIVGAKLLILLTDVEGLYDGSPSLDTSRLIPRVTEITDEIKALAGGIGSSRGTGGMITKLQAAEIAMAHNIATVIACGNNPDIIYDIVDGKPRGTRFER